MPPKEKKEILVPFDLSRESRQMLPVGEVAAKLYSKYKSHQVAQSTQFKGDISTRRRANLEKKISLGAARSHYIEHREAYKQAAAEEARSKGYSVRYPNQDPKFFERGVPKRLRKRGPRTW
jgi:hypothetical protein